MTQPNQSELDKLARKLQEDGAFQHILKFTPKNQHELITFKLTNYFTNYKNKATIHVLDDSGAKHPQDVETYGEISDGYHTFDELYRFRALYNAAFFNESKHYLGTGTYKSKKHSDGKFCFDAGGEWFIVMTTLPTGQISNHYHSDYWDLFRVPEQEVADVWDGHTPKEAAERERLARIKELQFAADNFQWSQGTDYLTDRIAELQKEDK